MTIENAFTHLKTAIDEVAASLGGSHFLRTIVARAADEIIQAGTKDLFHRYEDRRGLTFCYYLFTPDDVFRRAAETLTPRFALHGLPPITWRAALQHGGQLVVRGESLRYESDSAGFTLVFAVEDGDKWRVSVLDAGQSFAERSGRKIAVATTYPKTHDGVIKALRRLAEEAFGVKLAPVHNETPNT